MKKIRNPLYRKQLLSVIINDAVYSTPWYVFLAMFGAIVTATILRIYQLGGQSLWQDEIFRTLIATYLSKGWGDVVTLAAVHSFQPPMSYWATRVMFNTTAVFGLPWSDFLARFPSVIFGVATIPVLYVAARDWIGKREAWVATLLMVISPLHIRYSQEVAPYALWPLVILTESYFLVRALNSRKVGYWLLSAVFMVLAVYTHSFSSVIIALQVVAVGVLYIVHKLKKPGGQVQIRFLDMFYTGISAAVAVVAFLPLLKGLLAGSSKYMVGLRMPFADYLSLILNSFSPLFSNRNLASTLVLAGFVLVGMLILIRHRHLEGSILAASLLGVTLVEYILLFRTGSKYFYPRYIIGILPLFLFALSVGLVGIATYLAARFFKGESPRNTIASNVLLGLIVTVIFLGNLSALPKMYRAEKQDWRGLTQYLVANLGPHDAVTFSPFYYQDYYHYYFPDVIEASERFQLQTDNGRFENLYLVADKGADITDITEKYGNFEKVRVFPGGLALWRLKIGLSLHDLPLLNQDFSILSGNGTMIPSLFGWSVNEDGRLQVVGTTGQFDGNMIELRFDKTDNHVGVVSPTFPVVQERVIAVEAMIKAENPGLMGANLRLVIRDRNGSGLATFESDAIKGTQGWLRFMLGGITPKNASVARLFLQLFNPPRESGAIWFREIHVYGDWQPQQISDPLRQFTVPNADFTIATGGKIAWWRIPTNKNVAISLDKMPGGSEENALLMSTTGSGADYVVSSPLLEIDVPPGGQFVFQANVKTKNLSGPKGMEIAIGWVGADGKVFQWADSRRLVGTNDWQVLNIVGQVPEGAAAMILIPLRIFDSGGAGESVWVDKVELYLQGQVRFNDQAVVEPPKDLEEIILPNASLETALVTGVPDWWNFPKNKLVSISLDETHSMSGKYSLWAITTGSGADYLAKSPVLAIQTKIEGWFLFQAEVKTENLSGPKGMEIAIGWVGADGKVFKWADSRRLVGTNDWQVLNIVGQVQEGATGMILIPMRIFDSGGAGESVWVDKVELYLQGQVRFNDQAVVEPPKDLEEIILPNASFETALVTGVPDWWNFPKNKLVSISLDETHSMSGKYSLWAITTGSGADYLARSPALAIQTKIEGWFLFQAEVKTENLSGPKGMEIAIGWVGADGKVFKWADSRRLVGTNDWQVLKIEGQVPEGAAAMILIPLRIFDSGGAGEAVWVDQISLWLTPGVSIQIP